MFIRIKFYPLKNFTMTLHGHMSCFSSIFAVKIILISIFFIHLRQFLQSKGQWDELPTMEKNNSNKRDRVKNLNWLMTNQQAICKHELRGNPANFHASHYTRDLWVTFLSSAAITAFCRLDSPFVAKKQTSNFSFQFFVSFLQKSAVCLKTRQRKRQQLK